MNNTISIRKGNDKTVPFQLKDGADNLNIAGATVELLVKEDLGDADASAKIAKISSDSAEMTIVSAVRGKIEVIFVPADTSALSSTVNYLYDIRVIVSGGKEYNTEKGQFIIEDVVNRLDP